MTKEQLKEYGLKVTQANGTELVALTYEIASAYIKEAEHTADAAPAEFRECLKKSRALIGELITSLDMNVSISGELMRIYLFINRELIVADIRKSTENLPRIRKILERLRETFEGISIYDKNGPVMKNTQQIYAGLTYSKGSLNENMYSENTIRGYTV